jgi:hypothetical protein
VQHEGQNGGLLPVAPMTSAAKARVMIRRHSACVSLAAAVTLA